MSPVEPSHGAALLAGAGALLVLLPSWRRGAGGLAFAALAGALLLAARALFAGAPADALGALARLLVAAGGLGTLLLGAAQAGGVLPARAAGFLLLATAGLDLACGALRLELLVLGWIGAQAATLFAARAAGWLDPPQARAFLGELLLGAGLLLLGAGGVVLGAGTARLDRMACPVAHGEAALVAGGLALALALTCPPGSARLPRRPELLLGFPAPLAAWIGGTVGAVGALLAARALVPLATAGPVGPWRELLAGLGLVVGARGAWVALRARALPGVVGGAARAQAGWLLLALAALAPTRVGTGWVLGSAGAALSWQALTLVAAGLGGWGFCALAAERWGDAGLARLVGLGRRNAALAVWLLVPLLALAGLPPGPAFPGRVALLGALGRALPAWAPLAAALLLLPGLLLPLRVARVVLHGGRPRAPEEPLVAGAGLTLWIGCLGLLLLALGGAPAGLERTLGALALP